MITIDFATFARQYARLLYNFANSKSSTADVNYANNPSDQNGHSQAVWNQHAEDCDYLREEVEDLIYEARKAAAVPARKVAA